MGDGASVRAEMSEAEQHARRISEALAQVVGGADLSTDELVEIRNDALAALDELMSELFWLAEKLDNIQAESRRAF